MEIFSYSFVQHAIVGILLISIVSAMIGTYIVARRQVFISGGITHACFGGLGLGYFLGVSPILMASVFAVGASLGVEWISSRHRMRSDSAIAVVWALGMAIGTIFIFLTPGYVPDLNSFLFGNILTITRADLLAFLIFAIVTAAFFFLFFRMIVICAFDADFARTIHVPVRFINYAMTILVAVSIVLTIRMIGIMLLMSLFTMPQLVAEQFARRFKSIMALSVAVSVTGSLIGLVASYFIDVPASATIVLALTLIYALSRIIKLTKL